MFARSFRRSTMLLIALLTACASASSQAPSQPSTSETQSTADQASDSSTELVIVSQDIAAGLDPVHELTSPYLRGIGAGECLMRIAADGSIVPELAESMTQVDPTTWEIRLRPEVKFWSGATVDATAVQASLERSRALDAQAGPFLEGLTFDVIDPLTLKVRTATPNPMTPFNLAYYQLLIHNAEAYGPTSNPFDLKAMDLTGMFRVIEFTPKQAMVLEANPHYWGEAPQIQRIRHEEIKDAQARALAAESGQAQIVTGISAENALPLQSVATVQLVSVPAANTTTVYFNLQAPVLSDPRVRQALNWAIARQEVVDLAREGFSQPVGSWLASNPAFPEAAQQGYSVLDRPKAAALLDEAGWRLGDDGIRVKDGQPLTFRLLSFGSEKAVAEVLQAQWSEIGVKVTVEHVDDYGFIQSRRDAGDWEAVIEAWSTFGDPQALLSGQFKSGGKANYGGLNDPNLEALFTQLAQSNDETERRTLMLEINGLASELAPMVPLHPRPQITAIQTSVRGFEPHFRQFERLVTAELSVER